MLIDTPMPGTTYRAKLATLTFMVGDELDHVQLLMPVLDVMGSEFHHLGPVGAGAACKVANNLWYGGCQACNRSSQRLKDTAR